MQDAFLRTTGDKLAVDVLQRELNTAVAMRNTAKSRALRLVSELQTLLRAYDGSKQEWTDSALDDAVENGCYDLVKRIHEMLAFSDVSNRLVEEDDILRLEIEKPIQRQF